MPAGNWSLITSELQRDQLALLQGTEREHETKKRKRGAPWQQQSGEALLLFLSKKWRELRLNHGFKGNGSEKLRHERSTSGLRDWLHREKR